MSTPRCLATFAAVLLIGGRLLAQTSAPAPPPPESAAANPWAFSLTTDGYIVPNGQSYANPVMTADRGWLHLEARYNYENLRTGSLWAGYNFTAGKTLQLAVTPMLGGVFGRTTGIAPGCEASLTYKKLEFAIANEYVFDTNDRSGNFYYSWPEVTYSPWKWFRFGLVAQHTKVYQTSVDTQRGFLVGFSHKKVEFTTYVFNPDQSNPVTVLEVGFNF